MGLGVVGAGTVIGRKFRGDYHILIGEECVVGDGVVAEYGARIYDRCRIGNNCVIGGFICNDAVLGENSVVQGSLVHKRISPPPEPAPEIRPHAFIGTQAVVIGGVTIGEGSFVAAGAVVTKDTEPGFLYSGVPARKVRPARWY
jgi:acetyltransferase-like isoleucine patch superfamily enzyme